MTLRKRGVEPQGEHRRLDGHINPEDPSEDELPEGIRLDTDLSGDGQAAEPAGDWED